jgi:hypothetical protein
MVAELTALFERLISELPEGAATLNVYQAPPGSGATVIELKPNNAAAASFGVHCDDFDLFSFSFGVLSTWEFPYERRYRKGEKNILTEIEEMSRAVIAGNCEITRRWFCLTGRIYAEGYKYETTDLPMIPRPPFGTRRYAPFAQTT